MYALEFSAKIEHGAVQLPEIYHNYENAYVRVIVLTEKPAEKQSKKSICSLLSKKWHAYPCFARLTTL